MKYDDAGWHSGGNFPPESPEEYGATHIALFLRWCIVKGWASAVLRERAGDDVDRVARGELSATDFLLQYCDGKLIDEDLSAEGNAFASQYYSEKGFYLDDYSKQFDPLVYTAPIEAHDFAVFSEMVDARLRSGNLTRSES